MIHWQNDPDGYLVETLGSAGQTLAVAQTDSGQSVQWFSRWIAEGGHSGSATLHIDGQTARVVQGENAGQGLFVVWATDHGIASNELVLMLLGAGANSASHGPVNDESTRSESARSGSDGKGAAGTIEAGTTEAGTIETVFNAMQGQASLTLDARGTIRSKKSLKAKAALRLIARQGTAQTPSGLGAKMTIITDPFRPDMIRDQYLRVWFNGHPQHCRIALQIDDGVEFQPAFTWQNPGVTRQAILKIDEAEIPGDGQTHQIMISVWQAVGNRTSARATLRLFDRTPNPRPTLQPAWCGVTAIRRGESIRTVLPGYGNVITGHISDLTRVDWRHTGAVQIMAKIPVRNSKTGVWSHSILTLGYADYHETCFYVENLGSRLGWTNGILLDVLLGVAAIQHGKFGPIHWANAPVKIREVYPRPLTAPNSPDDIAGTTINEIYSTFRAEVVMALFAANGWTYPNNWDNSTPEAKRRTIAIAAIDQLLLRIKEITRKGGSVTLNDLGRFEARWNEARTVRSVAFAPSPGFREGVRAGSILTDAQAQALNP